MLIYSYNFGKLILDSKINTKVGINYLLIYKQLYVLTK